MTAKNQPLDKPAFQLKGSVLTLSMLQLLHLDYQKIKSQLEELVQKNPNFFQHMPVIIDLQKLYSQMDDINFEEINMLLRHNGLVPMGIMHANQKHAEAAVKSGLGILPNTKATQAPKAPKKVERSIERSKVITQPIRSGQQIYAKNADLIVLSSVSNGAEILADGNIHIYGALRGRAIAGANGDLGARIFCHKLEAELISIAGYYKLNEDLKDIDQSTSSQVFLKMNN